MWLWNLYSPLMTVKATDIVWSTVVCHREAKYSTGQRVDTRGMSWREWEFQRLSFQPDLQDSSLIFPSNQWWKSPPGSQTVYQPCRPRLLDSRYYPLGGCGLDYYPYLPCRPALPTVDNIWLKPFFPQEITSSPWCIIRESNLMSRKGIN